MEAHVGKGIRKRCIEQTTSHTASQVDDIHRYPIGGGEGTD